MPQKTRRRSKLLQLRWESCGCPYYKHILETTTAPESNIIALNPSKIIILQPILKAAILKHPIPTTLSITYANAASNFDNQINYANTISHFDNPSTPPTNKTNQINIESVLNLLKELLITLTTTDNLKETTLKILNSFIALLSHHG